MAKLPIYYYDDGKTHSIYINWYWHEYIATENMVTFYAQYLESIVIIVCC